ncbi:hypothetical protein I7I53_02986 [Histoplasma capsulatum var. duboisii H88]|uniref:Uncharacterized protein n=1 Tax=Ajellomyces capsulatus (strain H88) TaxID=544711 RepID=A0A8A1LMJ9_AJEC8|nr:hypothetical protein I7I53_02986 [Histoplasma capsulatum var. duboisii H88]
MLEGWDWIGVIRTLYTTTALVVIEPFCPSGLTYYCCCYLATLGELYVYGGYNKGANRGANITKKKNGLTILHIY